MTGKVRTLRTDKGFGFIKDDGGQEYFFHQSAIYGETINDLREGIVRGHLLQQRLVVGYAGGGSM